MASLRLGAFILFAGALAGCGSVASNAGDGSADHASGAAGTTGAAGAAAGSSGTAGTAGGSAGTTGTAGGSAGTTGTAGGSAGTTGTAGGGGAGGATGAAGTAGGGGATGAGGGGAGGMAGDKCEQDANCASGVCWQQLDGVRACFAHTAAPMLQSCQFAGTTCCMADADCTEKAHGRCVPKNSIPNCGGAVPVGNTCLYDQCATDADCKAGMPAGATVATCLPAIQGRQTTVCAYGACRTHADCTKHPGGACTYGLGPTHGQCSLVDVLFCAYPSDPCPAQACTFPMVCVPNDNYQGRQCGQGPPMYP
jgi:hypothetical protein